MATTDGIDHRAEALRLMTQANRVLLDYGHPNPARRSEKDCREMRRELREKANLHALLAIADAIRTPQVRTSTVHIENGDLTMPEDVEQRILAAVKAAAEAQGVSQS